jgi:tripartite-type tricarboxylate transporter receptor subunit TctC
MRKTSIAALAGTACLVGLTMAPLASQAQSGFPSKALTMIVPLAAGGPIDQEARLYAKKLAENTRWQVLVDNKPGGGGTIAMRMVAQAPADGHTLFVSSTGYAIIPVFYTDLPFNPLTDLAPVTLLSSRSNMLVVTASFPGKTVADYVAFARANPGAINFGTTGSGSAVHMPAAWLHQITGTSATFIHYKGTGPLMPDLVAGRIHATNAFPVIAMPFVKDGKLRAIGVTGKQRVRKLPDIPSIAETVPEFGYESWTGLFTTGKTPAPILTRLNTEFVKVVKDKEIVQRLDDEFAQAEGNSPEEFRNYYLPQIERWKALVRDTGIKLDP